MQSDIDIAFSFDREVEVVRRKLVVMIECLRTLEPIKNMMKDEYLEDIYKRKATERLLQELIEAGSWIS